MFLSLLDVQQEDPRVQQDGDHPDRKDLIFRLEGDRWLVSSHLPRVREPAL